MQDVKEKDGKTGGEAPDAQAVKLAELIGQKLEKGLAEYQQEYKKKPFRG